MLWGFLRLTENASIIERVACKNACHQEITMSNHVTKVLLGRKHSADALMRREILSFPLESSELHRDRFT
jgi:hypothetical protein